MIDWRQEVIDLRRDFCGGRDRALATRPSLTTEHDVTTDRVFLRLGPNGALGADEHQWILYRSGNAVSFVHSTKLILARCIREKGIELSPEGPRRLGRPG